MYIYIYINTYINTYIHICCSRGRCSFLIYFNFVSLCACACLCVCVHTGGEADRGYTTPGRDADIALRRHCHRKNRRRQVQGH